MGLFLYDHLAKREVLPGITHSEPARPPGRQAAEARFHQRIHLFRRLGRRCAAGGVERHGRLPNVAPTVLTHWRLHRRAARVHDAMAGARLKNARPVTNAMVTARALVNAAGPWAAQFLSRTCARGLSASRCGW